MVNRGMDERVFGNREEERAGHFRLKDEEDTLEPCQPM